MNHFFLDIASHNGILACVTEEALVASREVSTRIRDHELIPLVEECLNEVGWEYADLDRIACVIGPGGFTSLRVAVSFANTLVDQLGIEAAGVHLSDLYFARISESGIRNPELFWLHSTKKDSLFVKGGKWEEPTLVSLEELKNNIMPEAGTRPSTSSGQAGSRLRVKWMGELLDEQRELINAAGITKSRLRALEEILPEFIQSLKYTKNPLKPWYGRNG